MWFCIVINITFRKLMCDITGNAGCTTFFTVIDMILHISSPFVLSSTIIYIVTQFAWCITWKAKPRNLVKLNSFFKLKCLPLCLLPLYVLSQLTSSLFTEAFSVRWKKYVIEFSVLYLCTVHTVQYTRKFPGTKWRGTNFEVHWNYYVGFPLRIH